MFLRRLLKDCSNQVQRHPQRSMSYVHSLLNLSKNPIKIQQQKYLHRMTPLHHETDHEILSRPDNITCTFITKGSFFPESTAAYYVIVSSTQTFYLPELFLNIEFLSLLVCANQPSAAFLFLKGVSPKPSGKLMHSCTIFFLMYS